MHKNYEEAAILDNTTETRQPRQSTENKNPDVNITIKGKGLDTFLPTISKADKVGIFVTFKFQILTKINKKTNLQQHEGDEERTNPKYFNRESYLWRRQARSTNIGFGRSSLPN